MTKVFNGRGVADLRKLTVTYTGTGRIVIRNIKIECEKGQKWSNPEIKLTTSDAQHSLLRTRNKFRTFMVVDARND